MSRRTALVVAAATLGLGLPLTGTASAADPVAFTTKALTFEVPAGPPGDERTCTVDATLYTPSTASAATPAPAIMATNGFGGDKNSGGTQGNNSFARQFAAQGYVTLSYSGLGFGNSSCLIELDDPDWDGRAGSALLDFLGGSRAASDGTTIDYVQLDEVDHEGVAHDDDPRVGMIGGSYGGEVQYAIAGIDARLDTIIPQITWNDLSYSLAPNNTSLAPGSTTYSTPGVEKLGWVSLFFAIGGAQPVLSPGGEPITGSACPNFNQRACTAKAQMDALGYPNADTLDLARGASVASYLDDIDIPVFISQGQNDTLFNLQESVATYNALKAKGTDVKLLWQFWGHSNSTPRSGELDATKVPDATFLGARYAAWFDRYLRDAAVDTGPEFEYFRDWAFTASTGTDAERRAAVAEAYGSAPAFPASGRQPYYLSGTGALVATPAEVVAGSAQFVVSPAPTSYSEIPVADQNSPVSDQAGTFAAFTSAPLAAELDQVGGGTLTVQLSAPGFAAAQVADPGTQLVLFAKVYDVAPDGTQTLPVKLVSPVRIADVTKPVTIELPGIVHRFAEGHRVRVVLAAGDRGFKNNNLTGPVTVVNDPAAPNVLSLPSLAVAVPVDAPPPVVPEAPAAVLLPLVALAGAALVLRRRRALA